MSLLNDPDEMKEFSDSKKQFLYDNGFLYSLTFHPDVYNCERISRIVDDAKKIGVNLIVFNAINAKINDEFIKAAKYIRDSKLSLEIISDCECFADDSLLPDKIANLYPHRIIVPLYSMEPGVHDSITGRAGSYDKTIAAIEKFIERDVSVNIYYQQLPQNEGSFDEVLEYTNQLNIEISYDTDKINNSMLPVFNLVNDSYIVKSDKSENDNNFFSRQKLFVLGDYKLYSSMNYEDYISDLNNENIDKVWKTKIL